MRRFGVACLWFLVACGAVAAQLAGGGTPVGSAGGTSGSGGSTASSTYAPCANQNFSLPALADNSYNATKVATGPLVLCSISGYARVQSPIWIKLYDEATLPNPQTDTPKVVLYVAPQEVLPPVAPLQFSNGLGFTITWGEAGANATQTTGASPVGGLNIGFRQ